MKFINTKALTNRLLVALAMAAASVAGLSGVAAAATCFTCHAPVGSSTDIRPVESTYRNITSGSIKGSHAKHIPAITTDANTCVPCHGTLVSSTNHRNGNIDVPGVGYSKTASFPQDGNPVLGTCSTVCHSTTASAVATPTWGTVATCISCHTVTSPTTGSHTKHMALGGALCNQCHTSAVEGSNGGSAHVDGDIDVTVGYPANVAKHAVGTYTGTCSTTCHSTTTSAVATPTWGVIATCVSCHTVTSPTTGAHTKHMALGGALCNQCHAGAVLGSNGGSAHYDGDIDVTQSYPANVAKHAVGTYSGTCTTACHSASTTPVTTPSWGGTANCVSCHTVTSPTTGSHTKHMALVGALCNQCHTSAVEGSTGGSAHGDGDIDVTQSYPANVAKHAVGTYTGTCSTLCHSATNVAVTTPTWGAAATCVSCHTVTSPTTGTHTRHMALAGALCNQCHAGAVLGSNGGTAHIDGDIDVTGGYPANVAKHVVGTYSGACSTAVCHGSIPSPTWGVNTANAFCTKCHGTATVSVITAANRQFVAPIGGTPSGTGLVSNDLQVGAHSTHLMLLNGFTNYSTVDYRCQGCHGTIPADNTYTHANSSSVPTFSVSNASSKWGAMTPTYSGGTCTNTYCHNPAAAAGTLNTLNAGSGVTPTWTNAAYIADGTKKTQANCGKCHKSPGDAGFTSTNTHAANITQDCGGCHGHNGETSGTLGKRHMDGIKWGGGESSGGSACGDCHKDLYDATTATYSMHSNTASISYKHYMNNDAATYSSTIPDGPSTNLTSRRCTMCHVDHNVFKVTASATAGRAFNMRDKADSANFTSGFNADYKLCLSCHYTSKTKFAVTPNSESNVFPIPYPGLTFNNATSVLTASTHGYSVDSTFNDGTLGNSTFKAICVKCHNDSIGRNGETAKSSVAAQDGTYKFGEHNSSIPGRLSTFGTDFYQLPAGASVVYTAGTKTLQVTSPAPNWVAGMHLNHYVVVTAGAGNNQRMRIIGNTVDTLTLFAAFPTPLDGTSIFDVTDDNLAVDNICFSCHSNAGQDKPSANIGKDWYNTQPMKTGLEGIKNVFTGDSGTLNASMNKSSSASVSLGLNTWTTANMAGYFFKAPGGSRPISSVSAPGGAGPYTYTITLASTLTSGTGAVEIMKPASHPLDTYARHESFERVTASSGWNTGDQGSATAAAAGSITDGTKLWSGIEFDDNVRRIYFPGNFDSSGAPASSIITGGGAGIVTFTAIAGFTPAIGDNYFIGGRHVSCADCHNPHASFSNPEGTLITNSTTTTLTASESVNKKGWSTDQWKGFLLKVTQVSTGTEQIRYITAFNRTTGQYTVSMPWTTNPATTGYVYEVLMGDKWTSAGQSGGRAGSGSSGAWGVRPTGWRTAVLGNMTTATGYKKIENVFDNVSTTMLGGGTTAGQRDMCIKCHSSYSFGTKLPMTPSGTAGGVIAKSTDVSKEFNPNNLAHHAVYARGKNQPLRANYGQTGISSSMNPNWPIYATATDTVTVTSGVAVLSGTASLPKNVLPGWFIYIGTSDTRTAITGAAGTASAGYLEITSISSGNTFTVRAETATAGVYNTTLTIAANQNWYVTAGLGSAFVPPYGPWSILRCTDCHGSTKTDPVGPHASVNKWLLKDADDIVDFEYFNGTTTTVVTPGAPSTKAYFCYNCHRRDVYGDTNLIAPASANLSRQGHASLMDGNSNTYTAGVTLWPQHCRMCHAGDKLGGIHGTNAKNGVTPSGTITNLQGKRFLNGSSWGTFATGGGLKRATTSATGMCYTANKQNATVDNCGKSHTGSTATVNNANYDYDNP